MSSRETMTALVLHAHVALRVRVVRLLAAYVAIGLSRPAGRRAGDRRATKDFKTSAVRHHGVDTERFSGLHQAIRSFVRRLPFPEPRPCVAPFFEHPTVCTDCGLMVEEVGLDPTAY
jgi:hypothetical protein